MNPAPHKDNQGFSWSTKEGAPEYLSQEQIDMFNAEGYLVVERCI